MPSFAKVRPSLAPAAAIRTSQDVEQLQRELSQERLLAEPRTARDVLAGPVGVQVGEIDARAETAAGTRENHDAHIGVVARVGNGCVHLVSHFGRVRVQPVRAIEGHRRDALCHVEEDVLIHAYPV